ncbi:MAG: hypothetical protein KDA92_10090 [Planctomycetales bacterium]|nr:hypothetical protein [Planctomycetales bacterium]
MSHWLDARLTTAEAGRQTKTTGLWQRRRLSRLTLLGTFVGQLAEHLDGPYDLQSPYRILKHDPAGFTSVELGPILQSPYSQEFLVSDLSFDITFADGQRLSHVNVLVLEPNALTLLACSAVVVPALRQRRVRP